VPIQPSARAITDEASPFALRSTRKSSEDSNAPTVSVLAGAAEQRAASWG
jgi:hypothetical protein